MLLLKLFLIGFCLSSSKIGKKISIKISISVYCLDDLHNFHTLPDNPQQILTYSWHIFTGFIVSSFQIQNTIRLSYDLDSCKFDHYYNSPNC